MEEHGERGAGEKVTDRRMGSFVGSASTGAPHLTYSCTSPAAASP